jgi:murein L,D-transpeptidase YafK
MRLQARPSYVIHRAFHHALVTLDVWRRNRSVAEAFRDPAALNGVRDRVRGRSPVRMAALAAVAAAVAAGCFAWRHVQATAPVPLAMMPATAAPAPAPAPGRLAPVPGKPAPAPKAAAVTPQLPPLPARFPDDGNVLLACKRDRTLYAYARKDGRWMRLAAFPMAIGRNSGDKGRAGDMRTPEGRFWITGLRPGPSEGPLYGSLIFTLNYPRPGDLAEGKGGRGIWIHGTPAGSLPTFTHGCLSLSNDDVLALSEYADAATPVIILPDSVGPDPAAQVDMEGLQREYPAIAALAGPRDPKRRDAVIKAARDFVAAERKRFPDLSMQGLSDEDRKAILARLEKWRNDWSRRDIEAYGSNYDAGFKDRQGRDRESFLNRKRGIFAAKTRIEMEIQDPKIEAECYGRARVSFRQDYLAEGKEGVQRSSEPKTLRLDEGPQGWLIITE